MKREIIEIDEQLCNGCGDCVPGCPEGALQIIDGKARLVSDLMCDGLGACIGECPVGAMKVVEREAEPYDEVKVMENIIVAGPNTIKAHLKHLYDHDEQEFLNQAIQVLKEKNMTIPEYKNGGCASGGCPGSAPQVINREPVKITQNFENKSELRQWPTQLHLVSPNAPFLENADLLIAADCAPFAYGNFHDRFLKNKVLLNLCPKLDHSIDTYIDKLAAIFQTKNIKSINIVRMEVPCCGGIETIVQKAMEKGGKLIMPKINIISIQGDVI